MFKTQFVEQFTQILTPEHCHQLAKRHGWHQRTGKIHPAEFLLGQVCGQLSALHPALSAQSQCYQNPVTRQAVDERYNESAVRYFEAAFETVLARSLAEKVDPSPTASLQAHFAAVRLFDSTHFGCAASLADAFPGCGGVGSPAGIKVLLSYEYLQSHFRPLAVLPGKRSDQGLAGEVAAQVGRDELGLFDKGFYHGAALRGIQERGGFFVIPWPHGVSVWEAGPEGESVAVALASRLRHHVGEHLALADVRLGQGASGLSGMRLVAYRLGEESTNRRRAALREKCRTHGRTASAEALELAGWVILVTNVPAEKLPVRALGYLYRVRWQIELIFKQLKSILRLDDVPTAKEHRQRCEVWSRLLGGVLLFSWHRYTNAACSAAHRCEISFAKLARRLAQEGLELARALFTGGSRLHRVLCHLWDQVLKSARKGHQKSRKTTWQNLCEQWLDLVSP